MAVLPSRDDDHAERVLAGGATVFCAADTPRQRLRAVLLAVLGEHLGGTPAADER